MAAFRLIVCFVAAVCCLIGAISGSPMLIHDNPTNNVAVPPSSPAATLLFHSASEQVYVARSPQFSVQVHGAGFALARPDQADILTVDLVDALPAQLTGEQRHGDAVVNYFHGSDASQWRSGVPVWERVRAASVYDGIDVVYYTSTNGQLEFDFELQPGADPSRIGMRFAAAWSLSVDVHDGSLTVSHPDWGSLTLPRPVIYQPASSASIDGGYSLTDNVAGFWLGDYDAALPLVIDPLVYSTFIGGSLADSARDVVFNNSGGVIIVGITSSSNFPTTPNAIDLLFNGTSDTFVSKFDASGALVFSTYLGGSGQDEGVAVCLDSADNLYVAGSTSSADFPGTANGQQPIKASGFDAFITKLSASGELLFSTYLGGDGDEFGRDIAVDASSGDVVVVGQTTSISFPCTANAFDTTLTGPTDAFVVRYNASGAVLFATLFGGNLTDLANGVAVDGAGKAFVVGTTGSDDLNTTIKATNVNYLGGAKDAFVAIFEASGALFYCSYYGGSNLDEGVRIALDAQGGAVFVGNTQSTDMETTPGAYSATNSGFLDVFAISIGSGGAFLSATYLGGTDFDFATSVAVDQSTGNALIQAAPLVDQKAHQIVGRQQDPAARSFPAASPCRRIFPRPATALLRRAPAVRTPSWFGSAPSARCSTAPIWAAAVLTMASAWRSTTPATSPSWAKPPPAFPRRRARSAQRSAAVPTRSSLCCSTAAPSTAAHRTATARRRTRARATWAGRRPTAPSRCAPSRTTAPRTASASGPATACATAAGCCPTAASSSVAPSTTARQTATASVPTCVIARRVGQAPTAVSRSRLRRRQQRPEQPFGVPPRQPVLHQRQQQQQLPPQRLWPTARRTQTVTAIRIVSTPVPTIPRCTFRRRVAAIPSQLATVPLINVSRSSFKARLAAMVVAIMAVETTM